MYLTPTTVYILVWPYRKVRSWGLRTINTPPPFEFNMPDTTVHILVRPYRKVGSWGLRIQYLLSVIYASDHPFISQYDLPEGQKWGITDHHSLCILTQVLVRFTGSVIDASIDHYRTSAFTKLWERSNTRVESSRSRYRTQEDSNWRPLRKTTVRAIQLEIVPPTPPLASANTLTTRQRNKSWHLTAIRSKDPPWASVNSSQTRQGNRAGT
jgi:hypothetical protein